MNIDVREYLRINPISVHELTLSDNGNDCFLFFPTTVDTRGYRAFTQTQLFKALQRSVFGDLLNYDTTPPRIKGPNDLTATISDKQFRNYVRRTNVETFMRNFNTLVATLNTNLDKTIMVLRRKGVLNYQSAVELQSVSARTLQRDWNT